LTDNHSPAPALPPEPDPDPVSRRRWLRPRDGDDWIPRFFLFALAAGVVYLGLRHVYARLTGLLGILAIALFVSFALEPAVNWLARRRWPRGLATLAVMVGAAVVAVAFVGTLIPVLIGQVRSLVAAVPGWIAEISPRLQDWFGIEVSQGAAAAQSQRLLRTLSTYAADVAGSLLGFAAGFVSRLFWLMTIFLFAFYFIADGPRFRRTILALLPPERQGEVLHTWEVAIEKTGGYLYAKSLLAAISAVSHFIALTLLGIPYPLAMALWMGTVSQFIPTVGTYLAAGLPLIVALLDDPLSAVIFGLFILIYQQIENYLLMPRVTAHTLEMHGAVAFGAVIIGASLFGPMGAFLAIPAAAILQAVIWASLRRYDVVASDLTDVPPPPPRTRPSVTAALRGRLAARRTDVSDSDDGD